MSSEPSTIPLPDFERDCEFVALRYPNEYPFNEGRIVSNKGLDIPIREYEQYFAEEHVAYSNALHSALKDRGAYFVGPLPRSSLYFHRLSAVAQARSAGLGTVCRNPFQGIIVRSVETLYACDEALRVIGMFETPDKPCVDAEPRVNTGFARRRHIERE